MTEVTVISLMLGAAIGLLLGITGAGGTVLALPLLTLALHLSLQQAAPIVLACVFLAASIGALQGLQQGYVRYKTATLLASFGMLCTPAGIWLAHRSSQQLLEYLLIASLLWIAYRMWKQSTQVTKDNASNPPPACTINPATSRLFWTASCTKRLILTGGMAGLISGLLGLGGGFIIVPSLYKVSNFDSKTITATTLAAVALISAVSFIGHLLHGGLRSDVALPFVGSACAIMLTTHQLRNKIPEHYSQRVFALLCLLAAARLVVA